MTDTKKTSCSCCKEGCTCGDCPCCTKEGTMNDAASGGSCCGSMKHYCSAGSCGHWWKWLLGAVLLLLAFGAGAMFGSHKGGKYGRGDFGGGCPMMQKMHGGMKGGMGCGMMKEQDWSITTGQVNMSGAVVGSGN